MKLGRIAIVAAALVAVIGGAPERAAAAGVKLTFSPHSLSFGKVQAGTVSSKTVNLSSSGNSTLFISTIDTNGPFTLSAGTCSNVAIPTKPSSCQVFVAFHPDSSSSAKGTKVTGELIIQDTAFKFHVVKLKGTQIGTAASPPVTAEFYVTSLGFSTVTSYAAGSKNGDVSPTTSVGGSNTGLGFPEGMTQDLSGNLYVANQFGGASGLGSVTVFPTASNGNVTPSATIAGASTTLHGPGAVALDSIGKIYVANADGNSINVYPSGSDGDVAPLAAIIGASTGLNEPEGIVLDASDNIYVTNCGAFCGGSGNGSLTIYPPLGSSTGNLDEAPSSTIQGGNTKLLSPAQSIAFDIAGNVYVTNSQAAGGGSITKYAAASIAAGGNLTPIATIAGSNTGLSQPYGIAVDSNGLIYAVNNIAKNVTVYPAGSNGNVSPVVTIFGPNAGMTSGPDGILLIP